MKLFLAKKKFLQWGLNNNNKNLKEWGLWIISFIKVILWLTEVLREFYTVQNILKGIKKSGGRWRRKRRLLKAVPIVQLKSWGEWGRLAVGTPLRASESDHNLQKALPTFGSTVWFMKSLSIYLSIDHDVIWWAQWARDPGANYLSNFILDQSEVIGA